MSDLFQDLEEIFDQRMEELLSFVRQLDGQSGQSGQSGQPGASTNRSSRDLPADSSVTNPIDSLRESVTSLLANPLSPPSGAPLLQSVGGLSETLRELRELVEIPIKRPDWLKMLGLEPTRGVLLVGPPGTGKTLTARALAAELGINCIAIVGPEVMGKYYGEAEARLRSLFEKAARSAPCLIFIDEIDALAPDRSSVEGEVEKRVVAQLLSLMDGFARAEGVIVLAATNRPDQLDPALRRPGRFDREVQFRVPSRDGRLEILKILTQAMPLERRADPVDLGTVADLSVGMVGADLKAICQKAAYSALRRIAPAIDRPAGPMSVTQADFLQALKAVKPAVLRSVEVESPQVSWEAIGGLDSVKQCLQEAVEGALLYPELYQRTGAKAPRGVLLWGLPGTGKTMLAKAVASQARANFIAVNGSELMSKWVGASEQAVRELFAKARQAAPCVVFVDEIDTMAPARGSFSSDGGVGDRVVGGELRLQSFTPSQPAPFVDIATGKLAASERTPEQKAQDQKNLDAAIKLKQDIEEHNIKIQQDSLKSQLDDWEEAEKKKKAASEKAATERAAATRKAQGDADSLIKQAATSAETYAATIERLDGYLKKGQISQEKYNEAAAAAKTIMDKANEAAARKEQADKEREEQQRKRAAREAEQANEKLKRDREERQAAEQKMMDQWKEQE